VCSIPGHKEAGMRGAVLVAGQPASANPTDEHGHVAPTANQPNPSVPPPPYVDPTAPRLSEETVHTLGVRAEEKLMTVARGYEQRVWTFNGTVPAPTLRVRVGDTIRGRFMNMAANQTPHSLDFHASEVAWNGQMATINPGESLAFEWKANHAGVYMYHCVTAPPVHHVASGMFGMMIVEPKQGLPPVNKEFFLVQNEWYLGPQKQPISLTKAAAGAPAPDFMAFNGVADQYVDHPLQVNSGERVRIFVLNAGPNLMSSLHIVGMIFDSVIKEGVALTRDNSGQYGSQAVDLAPAQGAIVEFTAPEDGMYEIVTHMFNYHDRGAHGLIQVGDGIPKGKFAMTRR
jgi:nitrite reductase (NO-forming)